MQLTFLLSLIFATITTSLAAVSRGTYENPEYPGKCVVQGLVLSPGDRVRDPQKCGKISCYDKSKATMVTCSVYIPPDGCTLGDTIDASATYPQCCKRELICSNGYTFST